MLHFHNNHTKKSFFHSQGRASERFYRSLTRAIGAVIAARGVCVPDLVMRSGRRGRRLDGKTGELKRQQHARQQKATNKSKPVHPDSQAAYGAFMADEGDACELDADESDDKSDDEEEDE